MLVKTHPAKSVLDVARQLSLYIQKLVLVRISSKLVLVLVSACLVASYHIYIIWYLAQTGDHTQADAIGNSCHWSEMHIGIYVFVQEE